MESIQKILKNNDNCHDILTQKRIHHLLSTVIDELGCKYFKVPKLIQYTDSEYCTEIINTHNSIYIGMLSNSSKYKEYLNELCNIWRSMWYQGFALYDFELYIQPNGLIYIMDFSKTGFRMTTGPTLFAFPFEFQTQEYFFEHPCFPNSFLRTLFGSDEFFQTLKNYPYREKIETRNPA
jgi:hypothetical protein